MKSLFFSHAHLINSIQNYLSRLFSNRPIAYRRNLFYVFCIFCSLIIGCKEEDNLFESKLPSYEFESFNKLFADKEDPNNQAINEILLVTALSFNTVIKDHEIKTYIQNELKNDPNSFGISLLTLCSKNPIFHDLLTKELVHNLQSQDIPKVLGDLVNLPSSEIVGKLEAMMVYNNESYMLSIYLNQPNATSLIKPRTSEVITAIAESVNDDDEVLAFIDTDTFLLSEEYANTTSETIIFIGDGAREQINLTEPGKEGSNEIKPRSNEVDVDVDTWRIQTGFRFENFADKYSEVKLYVIEFEDDGDVTQEYHAGNFNPMRVHYNDIDGSGSGGTFFNTNYGIFSIDDEQFDDELNVHIGAYEYDWYASKKSLDPTCTCCFPEPPNAPAAHVRMKYSNEWYFFDCHDIPNDWPNDNSTWSVNISNPKCDFVFLRDDN